MFSIKDLCKTMYDMKKRNGLVFKDIMDQHTSVTVQGVIRYISEGGGIGLIDGSWLHRNFHGTGPEVQVQMKDAPDLRALSRGDVGHGPRTHCRCLSWIQYRRHGRW